MLTYLWTTFGYFQVSSLAQLSNSSSREKAALNTSPLTYKHLNNQQFSNKNIEFKEAEFLRYITILSSKFYNEN